LTKGLAQKTQCSFFEGAGAMRFVRVCGDKNDGNTVTFASKDVLQVKAAQARHLQIRYQAGGLMYGSGLDEQFRGCEGARFVSQRKKQTLEAI
jgi:hypothetical protein